MNHLKKTRELSAMKKTNLEISVGETGSIKNTYIDNPTWEQVENAISLINGTNRRNVSILGTFVIDKSIRIVGGIITTKAGDKEPRVIFYYQDIRDTYQTTFELIDPNSTNTDIVFVEKYTSGNNLRPYNQTVPIAFALQVMKDIWDGKDVLPRYKWTDKRQYGG